MSNKKPPARNLPTGMLGPNDWNPDDVAASLTALYAHASDEALRAINWYQEHTGTKRLGSKALRGTATGLGGLGALAPMFSQAGLATWGPVDISKVGYILIGLGLTLVALDRFFGFSSGYVRYATTSQSLQASLSQFQMEWTELVAKNGGLGAPADPFLARVRTFLEATQTTVEKETQAWATEFQANLAELERHAKSQQEAIAPGAIEVEVTNLSAADGEIEVLIDGAVRSRLRGSAKAQVSPVFPGQHAVSAKATVKQKAVEAAATVIVSKGGTATVSLTLPA